MRPTLLVKALKFNGLTLQSLSNLQATPWFEAAPRDFVLPGFTGSAITDTGLITSPSKEAALTLGGVKEAAAHPIATPTLAEEDPGLELRTGEA